MGAVRGLGDNAAADLKAFIEPTRAVVVPEPRQVPAVPLPDRLPVPEGKEQTTQTAFGKILLETAKSKQPLGNRIVTRSPDVTVSTNLDPFVNQRGSTRRRR